MQGDMLVGKIGRTSTVGSSANTTPFKGCRGIHLRLHTTKTSAGSKRAGLTASLWNQGISGHPYSLEGRCFNCNEAVQQLLRSIAPSTFHYRLCAGMAESNGTTIGAKHQEPHLALVPQRFTKVCLLLYLHQHNMRCNSVMLTC